MRGFYFRRQQVPSGKIVFADNEITFKYKTNDREESRLVFDVLCQYARDIGLTLVPAQQSIRISTSLSDLYHSRNAKRVKQKKIVKRKKRR